jgi:hypothetical protein
MKKEQRKEFEQKIITSIEQLLMGHDVLAARKIKKHIREAGKTIAKKFAKAIKAAHAPGKNGMVKEGAAKKGAATLKKVTPKKKAAAAKKTTK